MNEPPVADTGPSRAAGWAWRAAGPCGLLILVVACFGPALFAGRQFAFRDAGHFYYPLYARVQEQWRGGALPLWEPAEDGGLPLLGSPQAAVLYPGKLVYGALPYAWAARVYIVGHVLLAFAGLRLLLRSWGVSSVGATLGGLAYAFGTPVLFLYSNVIYLVGAAWAPLGFRSADRWLRLGRRGALIELALVLAMQALGGDLEAAYLTGVCSAGYAVVLAKGRTRGWKWAGGIGLGLGVWALVGPWLSVLRSRPAQVALAGAWGVALVALLAKGVRGRERSPLGARMVGLMGAAALAIAVGAVQLVPVAENLASSGRWGEIGPFDLVDFSLEPFRAIEWAWPNAFGSMLAGERSWIRALPPLNGHRVWVPSLYFGTLPLVLALGAWGFRGGSPGRGWLSAVAALGFLGAAGRFADPPTWLGFPAGGDFYRLMATALPGFAGFRYPSKLLVFVTLAMAGLAGFGWDRVVGGRSRRALAWALALLVLTLATLAAVGSARGPILRGLQGSVLGGTRTVFGPFDPAGVWLDMLRNLAHGAVASALAVGVIVLARSRPLPAGAAAVLILAVDLALANDGLILTLPQGEYDRPSQAARALKDADGPRSPGGRLRTYRMAAWTPSPWEARSSPSRSGEYATWERDTLYPNFGLMEGVDSILSESGSVEREDFDTFFRPYLIRVEPKVAGEIGVEPGSFAFAYPRRAFDLWGVRYFLLPVDPGDWKQGNRALISFLDQTEVVSPGPGQSPWPADFQVRRNLAAYPRAWTVHDFVALDPGSSREAAEWAALAAQYLAAGQAPRAIPPSLALDPRVSALIESERPDALAPYATKEPPSPSELPRVVAEGPTTVELEVTLERPGLVVLADRFGPGWRASVDGEPAVVLKANALMRATAVRAGAHRIVYRYEPASLKLGAALTVLGLVALLAVGEWARPGRPSAPGDRGGGLRGEEGDPSPGQDIKP